MRGRIIQSIVLTQLLFMLFCICYLSRTNYFYHPVTDGWKPPTEDALKSLEYKHDLATTKAIDNYQYHLSITTSQSDMELDSSVNEMLERMAVDSSSEYEYLRSSIIYLAESIDVSASDIHYSTMTYDATTDKYIYIYYYTDGIVPVMYLDGYKQMYFNITPLGISYS